MFFASTHPLLSWLRPPYRLHSVYERLLGTEVELQIVAADRAQAQTAETAALDELDRLKAIFDRFDPESELRRWLRRPAGQVQLSPELWEVLARADHWREATGGAFHPGADALGAVWKQAVQAGERPDEAELRQVVQQLGARPWTLHPDGSATLHATYELGLNALAKGYIVDRMAELAARQPGVSAVLVNAGGDLRTIGGRGLGVQVADPFTARDDAPALGTVRVRNAALATSGSAHRGYDVGGQHYSHVIDPRTGQPVQDVPGVTVVAPDCATADALATALSVLELPAGLALADATPGAAALVVGRTGHKAVSQRWNALTGR